MFDVLGTPIQSDEDLLFSRIMDKIAEVEGEKAIERNRMLKESGDLVLPEDLNRKCMELIDRLVK